MSSSPTEHAEGHPDAGGAGSAAPAGPVLVDVTMPQMGVSVAEGTVIHWRVQVGDSVDANETICDISTDKIDTELPSPAAGVVQEILVEPETTVPVGAVLARIQTDRKQERGARALPFPVASAASAPSREYAPKNGALRYSPVVQRIATEHGIDLTQVAGTGRGGRVRKQDVLAFLESGAASDAPLHTESPYRAESVAAPGGQLSRMRRQIGEHMKRSLETAAHCTTWIEVDMAGVEAARERLGVTALAFVARAAIDALRAYPALNAWLEGERYQMRSEVNLGIAVSLGEDGLIVPVIRDAHELSVEGLAKRIRELARRARARELTPDDVTDGTFTITNPGQYGSIMATPIINQPQVAILDLEAIVKRPVVIPDARGADSIAVHPITILGLSWDHRALDGALAAQFLAEVRHRLEGVGL